MNKTYKELSEDQHLEPGSSLAKVYMIEAHLDSKTPHKDVYAFLNDSMSFFQKGHQIQAAAIETNEENFFNLQFETSEGPITFYLDTVDARFWFLHSMDKSETIDPIVEKLAAGEQNLDRVWMPIQLLEEIKKLGVLKGLGLDYDRRKVPDIDFEAPTAPPAFLIMQLWGNRADEVLRILRQNGAFPHATTLSKVKIRYSADSSDGTDYTLDDIKYDGKITARGTSFSCHNSLITTLSRKYGDKIREIEDTYAISHHQEENRFFISGAPIFIDFEEPIPNLELFCRLMFSCSYPFRLWGVPVKTSEKLIRVSGVDLHIGKKIDFEITSKFMRIFLPAGTCANTVIRIITNLQHYYDSRIDAQDGDGKSLLRY